VRVLLAYRCHDDGAADAEAQALPPGLLWMAAALRSGGHDAVVVNFSRLSWKDVERYLETARADAVAASLFTPNRRVTQRILRLARRARPAVVTLVGGPHAEALPRLVLERMTDADAVVTAGGESTLLLACNRVARLGRPGLASVPGLMVRPWPLRTSREPPALPDLDIWPRPLPGLDGAGLVAARDLRHVVASRRPRPDDAAAVRAAHAVAQDMEDARTEGGVVDVALVGEGLAAAPAFLRGLAAELTERRAGLAWEVGATTGELAKGAGARHGGELAAALSAARRAGLRRVRVTLDAEHALGAGSVRALREVEEASRTLARSGVAGHLTVRHGTPRQGAEDLARLRRLIRAFRPREGRLEPRLLWPGTGAWRSRAEAEGWSDAYWAEETRDVVPDASALELELGERALGPALREACRSAAAGPRDLQALERATGPCAWLDMEWGDYRAHVGDLVEAERCHVRAVEREPWSAQPWLRLAALRERRGDRAGAAQALRAVLDRVPRHQGAIERLDELSPPRRRRRASSP
jgi:hypothetical protein